MERSIELCRQYKFQFLSNEPQIVFYDYILKNQFWGSLNKK